MYIPDRKLINERLAEGYTVTGAGKLNTTGEKFTRMNNGTDTVKIFFAGKIPTVKTFDHIDNDGLAYLIQGWDNDAETDQLQALKTERAARIANDTWVLNLN
jgi:hypothetical protein